MPHAENLSTLPELDKEAPKHGAIVFADPPCGKAAILAGAPRGLGDHHAHSLLPVLRLARWVTTDRDVCPLDSTVWACGGPSLAVPVVPAPSRSHSSGTAWVVAFFAQTWCKRREPRSSRGSTR